MVYRTLRFSDPFPDTLNTGFEKMPVMKDWVWVAEEKGETLAILLAAPMHGLVYLMVIRSKDNCAEYILLGLLRRCMRDCKDRGFRGVWMHVNPAKPENRFIPLIRRLGGTQHLDLTTMLSFDLGVAARY